MQHTLDFLAGGREFLVENGLIVPVDEPTHSLSSVCRIWSSWVDARRNDGNDGSSFEEMPDLPELVLRSLLGKVTGYSSAPATTTTANLICV